MKYRVAVLLTHPVQYYSPWFAELSSKCDLSVFYAHRQMAEGQASAGFCTAFDWDVPLLNGYNWQWLRNVSRNPGLGSFSGCDTPDIRNILKSRPFDALILFGWNRKCYLQGWGAALRAGIPVFIRLDSHLGTPRSIMKRMTKRAVYSLLLPRMADYLSPGRLSDAYLRHYFVPPHRIHRLPHMVDTDRFSNRAAAARKSGADQALRQRLGISGETFVFLFAGKLIVEKRPELLIEAMSRIGQNDAQLWIAGDGPLARELKEGVEARGLPVRFLGFVNQSDLPDLYAAADCLVLPSSSETWGLVVNEAFACGIPAIVSREAGCVPELIEDGKTGWILSRLDPEELAHLLRTAVADAGKLSSDALAEKTRQSSYGFGTDRMLDIIAQKTAAKRSVRKNGHVRQV